MLFILVSKFIKNSNLSIYNISINPKLSRDSYNKTGFDNLL